MFKILLLFVTPFSVQLLTSASFLLDDEQDGRLELFELFTERYELFRFLEEADRERDFFVVVLLTRSVLSDLGSVACDICM